MSQIEGMIVFGMLILVFPWLMGVPYYIVGLIVLYLFYKIICFHASEIIKDSEDQHWIIQVMVRTIDRYQKK